MALVRTNITIPEETLALVDAVAGPRGRSAYISEVLAKQARRDNAIKVVRETAGALKGSTSWGRTPEEIDQTLRDIRDSSERDRKLYGEGW
jgi:histidinol phosphatase-like PHP family hydrolase